MYMLIHAYVCAHTLTNVINTYVCIYMVTVPKSPIAGFIPSRAYIYIRVITLVISTETSINIVIIACILEYTQPCGEASCADTSTNLQPNFAQQK